MPAAILQANKVIGGAEQAGPRNFYVSWVPSGLGGDKAAPAKCASLFAEQLGAYVDDTAITTAIKAHYIENKIVDAAALSVETLNGTVMLSGFAKDLAEKNSAEALAWKVGGVKAVKNEIAVRP